MEAASGSLTAACARVLRETRDPSAAAQALSAVLALLDPSHSPAPRESDTSECLQIEALLDEALQLEPRTALSRAFVWHHYSRWAATLLDAGLVNWRAALTSAAARSLFDSHLMAAPPREALEALVAALGTPSERAPSAQYPHAHERRMASCASLLAEMVTAQRVRQALIEHLAVMTPAAGGGASAAADDDALVSLLVALPARVANATRAAPPAPLAPVSFYRTLTDDLLRAISQTRGTAARMPPRARSLGGALLGRVARLGHFRTVLAALPLSTGDAAGRWGDLLAALPAGSLEAAVEAGVSHAASGGMERDALCSLYAPLLRASAGARVVLSERLLLLRVLPLKAVPHLIALLSVVSDGGGEGASEATAGTLLFESIRGVAEAWSSASHVSRASIRQQRYLTTVLLEGLAAVSPVDAAATLVPTLLGGVQQHLGAPEDTSRRLGMRVAEAVSRIIDPEHPLDFEQASSASEEEEDEEPGSSVPGSSVPGSMRLQQEDSKGGVEGVDGQVAAPAEAALAKPRRSARRRREKARAALAEEEEEREEEPDAPACLPGMGAAREGPPVADGSDESDGSDCSGDSDDSDASGDSDESYSAFDMTDDRSDLKAAQRPRHLRRLLIGLRAKEGEHEAVDAALDAAEDLVRGAADAPELHTLAPPLLRALLHLPDRYKLPRFAERRHGALVALAVRSPSVAARVLTSEFYAEHLSLEMRMQALRAIHTMADELAAPPAKPTANASSAKPDATAAAAGRQLGKTRRWGSSHLRAAPAAPAASLLGAIAPQFFYPLMGRYDDPSNTFKLLTEDCFLLEALLHCLAALLRGAAAYPCSRAMASALYELAWTLRLHDEGAVRRAALVSLCTVGRALLPAVLVAEYQEGLPDLQDWLRVTAENDADDACRQLAAACHAIYGGAVREEMKLADHNLELA